MEYVVKALSVGGLRNKIFKSGDVVTDENFPEGNAKKLVESGHLVVKEAPAAESEKIVSDAEKKEAKKSKEK